MYLQFFAVVTGASAVKLQESVQNPSRVLLFGSSLDRNAIENFCGANLHAKNFLQTRWCDDTALNVKIGFMFHPGVGYNGDLHAPFHSSYWRGPAASVGAYGTGALLKYHANSTSWAMLAGPPDLVVVDSSLWDLAVWREQDKTGVSRKRVKEWCQHDLPNLLEAVQKTFPTSRIAFRTAPTIGKLPSDGKGTIGKFTAHEIDLMYDCVTSLTYLASPPLLGKYEVIDYHDIVKNVIDRNVTTQVFMGDGYHPTWYPSALYVNELLLRVGVKREDPPVPKDEESENMKQLPAQAQDWFGPF
jgi:hypothetical protein